MYGSWEFFDHQFLWKESIDVLVFCMEIVIKESCHFWFGVVRCASHPIRLQDFFYHSTAGKNWSLKSCLHGNSHQGKVTSETTSFGWVLPGVSIVQSDCRILWWSVSLVRAKWYLSFYAWSQSSKEINIWDYHFGWVWPVLPRDFDILWLLISVDIPVILHGVSHQGKAACVPLIQSDCIILWSSLS